MPTTTVSFLYIKPNKEVDVFQKDLTPLEVERNVISFSLPFHFLVVSNLVVTIGNEQQPDSALNSQNIVESYVLRQNPMLIQLDIAINNFRLPNKIYEFSL